MKAYYSVYFFSFLASVILHITFFEGTESFFHQPASRVLLPELQRPPLQLRFTESRKDSPEEPEQPTHLVSDENNRASQPTEPADTKETPNQPSIPDERGTESLKTVEHTGQTAPMPQPSAPPFQQSAPTDIVEQPEQIEKQASKTEPLETKAGEVIIHKPEPSQETVLENDTETTKPPDETVFFKQEPAPQQPDQVVPTESTPSPPGQSADGILDELIHNYSGDKDSFAAIRDQIQFNIRKHSMGEYIAGIKKKIAPEWKMRLTKFYQTEMFSSGAIVVFKLDQNGNVVYSKILEQFGNQFFGTDCLDAVHQSAQFEPLPEEYIQKTGKKELWMLTTFGYDIR